MRPFRQELKFLIHYSLREMLLERWSRYLMRAPFTNEHAVTPVLSQYYDSPDLLFYHEKVDGLPLRNKVRIRQYSHRFERGATTFLEIKHRQHDLVKKYRYAFKDFDPEIHLDPANWEIDDRELESAILTLRERHRLRASAQTYYQREAYQGAVEADIRITFDTVLIGLHPRERLTPMMIHDPSRRLMADTLVILEVKATKGIPPWVHEGVVAAELRQKTIPKYISAVEALGLLEISAGGIYA